MCAWNKAQYQCQRLHADGPLLLTVLADGMRGKIVTAIKRPGIDGLENPRQEIRVCRADCKRKAARLTSTHC